jgi:ligand-binding sensor domain-containing protein
VISWIPRLRRWEGPYTPADSGVLDKVFCALVDPLDNSLWLGRTDGWVHFQPQRLSWERGQTPATVQQIAFDLEAPAAGLFLRTTQGWSVADRGAAGLHDAAPPRRPFAPATIEEARRAAPALFGGPPVPGRSDAIPPARRYTSFARDFGGRGWYVGTWGDGMLHLAEGVAAPERLRFGLLGDSADAVVETANGVWVATEGVGPEGVNLSFVGSDLSEFRWLPQRPFGVSLSRIRRLARRGPEVWAATERGLLRWNPDEGGAQLFAAGDGLPDPRVVSVAANGEAVGVGTAGGVARFAAGKLEGLAPAFKDSVLAVELSADTVWTGTRMGLFAAVPIEPELQSPRGLGANPVFRTAVRGLAWSGDTLVALGEDRLFWRAGRTWAYGPILSDRLGALCALVAYRDGLFVAGRRAFAFVRAGAVPDRVYRVPGDVPGEIRQLALTEDYLWMATTGGLVRWRLGALLP